jgi:hypothetical protein
MHDIRILTTDELSAVCGGATAGGSGLPHPQPSPLDRILQWILGALR